VSEHNKNVVTMLQSKLADTTIGFKDVLEIRTQVSSARAVLTLPSLLERWKLMSLVEKLAQNMKASRDRTEQFTYSGNSNPRNAPPSGSSLSSSPFRSLLLSRVCTSHRS
jgi:syntaxin 5